MVQLEVQAIKPFDFIRIGGKGIFLGSADAEAISTRIPQRPQPTVIQSALGRQGSRYTIHTQRYCVVTQNLLFR